MPYTVGTGNSFNGPCHKEMHKQRRLGGDIYKKITNLCTDLPTSKPVAVCVQCDSVARLIFFKSLCSHVNLNLAFHTLRG